VSTRLTSIKKTEVIDGKEDCLHFNRFHILYTNSIYQFRKLSQSLCGHNKLAIRLENRPKAKRGAVRCSLRYNQFNNRITGVGT
jgi:hypothetical protein